MEERETVCEYERFLKERSVGLASVTVPRSLNKINRNC